MSDYWFVFDVAADGEHVPALSMNYSRGCALFSDGWNHFEPYPKIQPASGWFDLVETPCDKEEEYRFGFGPWGRGRGNYGYYLMPHGVVVVRFASPWCPPPDGYLSWWPVGGWQ